MSSHLASRDDPNHLIFVLVPKGVRNSSKTPLTRPIVCQRSSPIYIAVRNHHKAGIIENQCRCLKGHLVFPIIRPSLLRVPIKTHLHRLYVIVYT